MGTNIPHEQLRDPLGPAPGLSRGGSGRGPDSPRRGALATFPGGSPRRWPGCGAPAFSLESGDTIRHFDHFYFCVYTSILAALSWELGKHIFSTIFNVLLFIKLSSSFGGLKQTWTESAKTNSFKTRQRLRLANWLLSVQGQLSEGGRLAQPTKIEALGLLGSPQSQCPQRHRALSQPPKQAEPPGTSGAVVPLGRTCPRPTDPGATRAQASRAPALTHSCTPQTLSPSALQTLGCKPVNTAPLTGTDMGTAL